MGGGETGAFKEHVRRLIQDQKVTQIVVDLGRVKWMNSSAIGIIAEGSPPKVVVDLGDVRWINSSAIGILASSLKTAWKSGGDIRLARVSQPAISVFSDTQLEKIFKSYVEVQEAVTSFDAS